MHRYESMREIENLHTYTLYTLYINVDIEDVCAAWVDWLGCEQITRICL